MLMKLGIFFGLLAWTAEAVIMLPHLDQHDLANLESVFTKGVNEASDLAAAHYGAAGLKLLGKSIPNAQKLCELAKTSLDATNGESAFHASSLALTLSSCSLTSPETQKTVDSTLAEAEPKAQELFFVAAAAKNLKLKVDSAKLSAALTNALKKDDSALSLGYAFHAGSLMTGDVNALFNRIEDTVAQADEVDGKYLQFEGGVSATAIAVSGIYNLADKANKAPSIKADEAVKLANFLLSRRGVYLVRPAYHLLYALKALTTNKYHLPVSMYLSSSVGVSSSGNGLVTIGVTNVLGNSVGPLSLSLDSATHTKTSGVVLSKKPIPADSSDKSGKLYSVKFLDTKRAPGFYKLVVSAASATDKRLVATQGAEINIKVMSEMIIDSAEVILQDRDQSTGGKTQTVKAGQVLPGTLEADSHQKISMKFTVKDKSTGAATTVHQAFVLFAHVDTKQEIIFVAEPDKDKNYKFDVDLQKSSKDFENLSGKYQMKLLIGDAVIFNPLSWHLANLNLKFPNVAKKEKPRHEEVFREPRKEIKHVFRTPEKRPPQIVSDTFTLLVLSPALLLLVLWLRIGVNISNFPFSLYALGFHVGLAGILGVYGLFWLKLNMFTTLKYLSILASVTFLLGNRMLRSMADSRKAKKD